MENQPSVPILFPFAPEQFWQQIRLIIREEVAKQQVPVISTNNDHQTPGLTYKPLYKIVEVCKFLQITRPTLYQWIKDGRIKPYKIKSRVYFLHNDIQMLLQPNQS